MAKGPEFGRSCALVVDDDPDFLEVMDLWLRAAGYDVLKASGGRDALLKLMISRRPIAFMLTDLEMPDMSGAELIKRLDEMGPPFPAILMSASPRLGEALEGEQLTFPVSRIEKSRIQRELLGLIQSVLKQWRSK